MKKKVSDLMLEASRRKRMWDREKNYLYICSNPDCNYKVAFKFLRCPKCEVKWSGKKELMTRYMPGEVNGID